MPFGQAAKALPTLRLQRVDVSEDAARRRNAAGVELAGPLEQRARLRVVAHAEAVRERRAPRAEAPAPRPPARSTGRLPSRRRWRLRSPPRRRRSRRRPAPPGRVDSSPARVAESRAAILPKAMTTYRQLLASVKAEIDEVSTMQLKERLDAADAPAAARRPRAGRVAGRPPARGGAHPARVPRVSASRASYPTAPARSSSTARVAAARLSRRRR